ERWMTMTDIRGEAFHRWRAQTAGVSTMTRRRTRVVGDDGLLSDGTVHDVRGPEDSSAAATAARDALSALGDSRAEFDRLLPGVPEAVTASRIDEDGMRVVHGPVGVFVESSRGTAVLVLRVLADRVDEFLTAISSCWVK